MSYFFNGLLLGFSIAAPVGPIGLLCIQRALAHGRVAGFVSGIGAATADATYGGIAAFGLSLVTNFLVGNKQILELLGGLFVCYLGLKITLSKTSNEPTQIGASGGLASTYLSTFLLTLANPLTILSFIGIFAGLGLATQSNSSTASLLMVAGVFAGSGLWWFLLTTMVGLLRHKVSDQFTTNVNRISGCAILILGLSGVWSSLGPWHR